MTVHARPADVDEVVLTMRMALSEFGGLPEPLSAEGGRIFGTAFFPGGDGLVYPRASKIVPDVLIVGHDFGTLAYFRTCIAAGEERTSQPTWRGIFGRLGAAGIDLQRCLFTNAFVGYRKRGGNTDDFPARADQEYAQRCRALVVQQIALVHPRAIIALGKHVPRFLSALSSDLPWSTAQTFSQIDLMGLLVLGARFGEHRSSVCALVHPSFGHLNVNRRRYRDSAGKEHTGIDAEIAILRDLMA